MQTNLGSVVVRLSVCLVIGAVSVSLAYGQGSVFASVAGHVSDATGAMVADATVAVLDRLDTNERREAISDSGGRYVFTRLVPGEYRLEAEKSGFRRTTVETLVLAVNDAVTRNLQIEAGDLSETVVVTAAAGTVQTRSAAVSLGADARTISELPLNGRDWSKLVVLHAGCHSGGEQRTDRTRIAERLQQLHHRRRVGNNNERSSGQPLNGGAAAFSGPNFISNGSHSGVSSHHVQRRCHLRSRLRRADEHHHQVGHEPAARIGVPSSCATMRSMRATSSITDRISTMTGAPSSRRSTSTCLVGPRADRCRRDRHFAFLSYEGFRQERQATSAFTFPNRDLLGLIPGDTRSLVSRLLRSIAGSSRQRPGPGEFRPLTAGERNAAIAAGFDPQLFDGNAGNGEAGTLLQSAAVPQDVHQNALLLRSDHVASTRLGGRRAASGTRRWSRPVATFDLASPLEIANETRRMALVSVGEVVGVLSPSHGDRGAGRPHTNRVRPTPEYRRP